MINTIQLNDPQGVINSLQARIEQLENILQFERRRNAEALPGEVAQVLKRLRLLCIIPLHVGSQPFGDVKSENENDPVLHEALDAVWPLANAPVSDDVKSALQLAANNGMSRWF